MDTLSLDLAVLDDQLVGGLRRGWLALVAGAPESGKTALALRLATSWVADGQRVLYCVLKDSLSEARSRATAQWLAMGQEADAVLPEASDQGVIEPSTLTLADVGASGLLTEPTTEEIARRARTSAADVVIVDDLDSVEDQRGRAAIALELSQLARLQGFLIVVLDSGRGQYQAGLPAPDDHDDAAASADVVLFTSRPAHLRGWPAGMRGLSGVVGVELAKNRYGETATTRLSLRDGVLQSGS